MRKLTLAVFSALVILVLIANWQQPAIAQCNSLTFGSGISSTTGNFGDFIIKGDFNNDGNIDLATIGRLSTQPGLSIMLGLGDGNFTSPITIIPANNGSPQNQSPFFGVTGDFNNDGKLDLLIANLITPTYQIYLGQGDGNFTLFTSLSATIDESGVPGKVALADLNGDGNLDFVAVAAPRVSRLGSPLQSFIGQGDGNFVPGSVGEVTPGAGTATPSTLLGVADLTGDSRPDLIVTTHFSNTNTTSVRVIPGLGNGSFDFANQIVTAGLNSASYFLVDLNKDNRPDLLYIDSGINTVNVQLSNGDGSFGSPTTVFTGRSFDTTLLAGVADFNNDGNLDLALLTRVSDGVDISDNRIDIFLGNGTGGFSSTSAASLSLGVNLPYLAVADFNNDGMADLAVFPNQGTDVVNVYLTACADQNNCAGLQITQTSLPDATVSSSYNQTLTATGGTGPYTFALSTGTLPTGLSLSSEGVLSGAATTAGNSTFSVTVTDANGCTASTAFTLKVNAAVNCGTITIVPPTLSNGMLGVNYNRVFNAIGGAMPYTFSVTGTLPTGITISSAGRMSGKPTVTGNFTFTVTATDKNGCSGAKTYTVTINCGNVIIRAIAPLTGTVGVDYTQTFTTNVGSGIFGLKRGILPPGLILTNVGVLSGKPTLAGIFQFEIMATTPSGCGTSHNFVIRITGSKR